MKAVSLKVAGITTADKSAENVTATPEQARQATAENAAQMYSILSLAAVVAKAQPERKADIVKACKGYIAERSASII